MGYIVVIFVGVALMVVFVVVASKNKAPKTGRISSDGQAILREEPSADAPTPGRSVTASRSEVKQAEKKTPPA